MHGKEIMIDQKDSIRNLLPLREPTFYILLSLSTSEKHGYAILREVEAHSAGRVQLSTGTLYEALARLLDQDLIERVESTNGDDPQDQHPGRPRKSYRLSPRGLQVLQAETDRLRQMVAVTQRLLSEETG
jgi:DNA-binding PadR family transcriptional regulator